MMKAALRQAYREKRLTLSPGELEERSNRICLNLFTHFQLEGKTISIFLPIERHREVNTYHILEKGVSIGARMALPKTDFARVTMKHYGYEQGLALQVNAYGIPELVKGKLIRPEQLDIVCVPLLAVSEHGHRIGYGKGFYDKFLKKCPPHCLFIGLHLFEELDVIDDVNKHDIPLHYCITPNRVIHFG
jgi:5-formyltetrahydrofolate cyclo-ligase